LPEARHPYNFIIIKAIFMSLTVTADKARSDASFEPYATRPPALNLEDDEDKTAKAIVLPAMSPQDRVFTKLALNGEFRTNVQVIAGQIVTNYVLHAYLITEIAKAFNGFSKEERVVHGWLSKKLMDLWENKPRMVDQNHPRKEALLWAGVNYYLVTKIPKLSLELGNVKLN
jgi:hypothetical protein